MFQNKQDFLCFYVALSILHNKYEGKVKAPNSNAAYIDRLYDRCDKIIKKRGYQFYSVRFNAFTSIYICEYNGKKEELDGVTVDYYIFKIENNLIDPSLLELLDQVQ